MLDVDDSGTIDKVRVPANCEDEHVIGNATGGRQR